MTLYERHPLPSNDTAAEPTRHHHEQPPATLRQVWDYAGYEWTKLANGAWKLDIAYDDAEAAEYTWDELLAGHGPLSDDPVAKPW